jgi:methylmalonyl-CoA carboxyltransferase 12S subunit
MSIATNHEPSLAESLVDLRRTIAALADRVAVLEVTLANPSPHTPRNEAGAALCSHERNDEVTSELLAVITAALAAHLGVRPRIRQIRLTSSGAWAQEGRATIQASHAITIQRD